MAGLVLTAAAAAAVVAVVAVVRRWPRQWVALAAVLVAALAVVGRTTTLAIGPQRRRVAALRLRPPVPARLPARRAAA